jgi:hypothetical protein
MWIRIPNAVRIQQSQIQGGSTRIRIRNSAPEQTNPFKGARGNLTCTWSSVRIRCLFDPWIRDPGWLNKSGSGMNNPDHISETVETIFWVKILKFFDADWGWKESDPG